MLSEWPGGFETSAVLLAFLQTDAWQFFLKPSAAIVEFRGKGQNQAMLSPAASFKTQRVAGTRFVMTISITAFHVSNGLAGVIVGAVLSRFLEKF